MGKLGTERQSDFPRSHSLGNWETEDLKGKPSRVRLFNPMNSQN